MTDLAPPTGLSADQLALLRTRTSSKWSAYPPDVLPMFVAEMDYPLATPIAARLVELISRSDVGYDSRRPDLGLAFASFASDAWDWGFDPSTLKSTVNVMNAATEILRAAIEPADGVVVNSPVYPPFYWAVEEAGGTIVDVPLLRPDDEYDWSLDLEGLEAAFAAGAKVYFLCHPHNPIGFPHPREQLERVAELAERYGVLVVSDEIHGALTHSDTEFVPYLAISDAARATGVAVTSASKAFNLAGLGCGWWVPGGKEVQQRIKRIAPSTVHRAAHIGVHAATAAFGEARQWLAGAVESIESNRELLGVLLAEHLPEVVYHEPHASYLAWLDFSALGWGDDPAKRILERGRVALTGGLPFGKSAGRGIARLNFACSPEVLEEGVLRIASAR